MRQNRLVVSFVKRVCALFLLAACGESAPASPAAAPPPAETIVAIEIARPPARIEVGDSVQLTAVVRSNRGRELTDRVITWTSSNPAVASISSTGRLAALAPGGPIVLRAEVSGVSSTAEVVIERGAVATVSVAQSAPVVVVGARVPLSAVLRDSRGAVLTDRSITWTSADPTIVTASDSGVLTGVRPGGPVVVTAASEGKQSTVSVTVRSVPVARVVVAGATADMNVGVSAQLSVALTDSTGSILTGRTVTWSSDSVQVATVDAAGMVTTIRPGGTRIRARVDGVEGSLTFTVRGLIHRWTFDENGGPGTVFTDNVRGARATLVRVGTTDDASAIGGMVTLSGGDKNSADYVALPARLLRTLGDATIEVWGTVHTLRQWSRVFDVGAGPTNNLFMAWSQGVLPSSDRVAFSVGGVETRVDNSLAPFDLNVQHHLVMSIDEGGGAGGRTRVAAFLDGTPRGSFETTYRLRDLIDDNFWLGRSQFSDETANASYDEVRIHDRVYAAPEVRALFSQGPARSSPVVALTIAGPVGLRDTVRGVDTRVAMRALGRDAQGRQFKVSGIRWQSSNPSVATIDSTGLMHAIAAGRVEITATAAAGTGRWTADVVRQRRVAIDPYLATPAAGALWEIPVVLVEYLPTADAANIDVLKMPDFWVPGPMSLDSAEKRILTFAKRRKMMVEQGSRFRGYRDSTALPSLGYRVIEHIIVYDITPASNKRNSGLLGNPALVDYRRVLEDLQLLPMMRTRRVREVWLAESAFDAGVPSFNPVQQRTEHMRYSWESNMSSPITGDISNSDRDPNDLPLLPHTYIVYGINPRRTQSEAVHNVGHQLEAMMSFVATRQDGNDRLFWRDFVGQDASRQFITGRAGWTHMPPNTTGNYDYFNTSLVQADIEDWRPDNTGQKRNVNVDTWGKLVYPWPGDQQFDQRVDGQWYVYWMQNFPGRSNRIPYHARWMTNWWSFVGDWDAAITSSLGLHAAAPAITAGIGEQYAFPADRFVWRSLEHEPKRAPLIKR
jgi:uncharacterized protein YjdB